MPSFDEARRLILECMRPLPAEEVPLLACGGRVLAADVTAPFDLPHWDNSAMDGFAVRSADCAGPAVLRVTGFIPAGGHSAQPVAPGAAVKILTGAPLPPGADAVVKVEDVEVLGDQVRVKRAVAPGTDVRRKGEDLRAGEVVLPAGTVLGPAEASALATLSRLSAPVVRRARVAILSTGDELVPPGQPLAPGKIHDSNAYALATAVAEVGGEPVLLGIARDEREALAPLLRAGLEADALLTTAGVSVGDRDLVRAGLAELGVRELFWKVDVRPGSPTAFGLRGTTPVFSLPGNPVATQLMFEEFARPALLRMMGHRVLGRPVVRAVLGEALAKKPGRTALVRVRLTRGEGRPVAHRAGSQETGILRTSLRADGLAVLPEAATTLPAGTELDVQVLRPDWSAREDGRS